MGALVNSRTVIGIVNNNTFKSKNGNDCTFIDLGFEKFTEGVGSSKTYSYDQINKKEFFCETGQAFLTSNASDVITNFNGQLVQIEVGESPNPEFRCQYTALFSNIKSAPTEDFIEIIPSILPSADTPLVLSSIRPSTKYVMLDVENYEIKGENFDFLNNDIKWSFDTLKEAEARLKKVCRENFILKHKDNENTEVYSKNLENHSEGVFADIKKQLRDKIFNEIGDRKAEDLSVSIHQIIGEAIEKLKNENTEPYKNLVDYYLYTMQMELRADVLAKLAENGPVPEEYTGFNEFDNSLLDKIEYHRYLVGPFCVSKIESLDKDNYRFMISIPDRGSFITNDKINATTKQFEYDSLGEYLNTVVINGNERKYLVRLKNWQNGGSKLDYIDEKKLVENYCVPILNTNQFRDLRPNSINILRQNARTLKVLKNQEDRAMRAFSLLEKVASFSEEREKFFKKLQEDASCETFIKEYVDSHASAMIEEYKRDMISSIKAEHDKLVNDNEELKKAIEKKRQELINLEVKPELEVPKSSQKSEKEMMKSAEYEMLKIDHKKLQKEVDSLKKELTDLEKTKNKISQELNTDVVELSSKYLDMHSMLRAFTSTPRRAAVANFSFSSPSVSKISLDNIQKSRNRYIEELTRVMRGMGRNIERNKLVSMVITIAQNQFTILAGLPGCGKTSFVKSMGKALNMNNRLHTIPVARGWTSQRDILGYWNSLAGNFQAAPTGLWELMSTMDSEKDDSKVTPVFLLLDEMNLSSPEHYFSSFLDLADGESERKVYTGSPELPFLNVPDYLRFIGTVNSDDTVNIMSPRMLDRAAVILFEEKPSQAVDLKSFKTNQDPMPVYSAKDWKSLFIVSEPSVQNSIYLVLNQVEELLYSDNQELGQRVVISYRKHQQILNFLTVATQMYENTDIALDFAMKQFVLPMINGFGEGFGNRLERLHQIFENSNLTDSARILRRIINEGADRMNSYQFLA